MQLLHAALEYAERWGWAVFPLLPRSKEPYPRSQGYKDATTNAAQITAWWTATPDANIGIACSSTTGPIVIDIDGPTGRTAIDALALAETRTAHSGKGEHLYFAPMQDGTRVRRCIMPMGKSVRFDILGDGGYVVAPPSIHPDTGDAYTWTHSGDPVPFPEKAFRDLLRTPVTLPKSPRARGGDGYAPAPTLPLVIGEGQRDTILTSLAGTMRRRGASPDAILAALRTTNDEQVHPPLPDGQLRKIAKSIGAKEPLQHIEALTDLGNARRFIAQHAHLVRSIAAHRRPWMIWDSRRWIPDSTGAVERMAKATALGILDEAGRAEDDAQRVALQKHAIRTQSAHALRAMLEVAASEPELSTRAEHFDANKWLFNVKNGTLDLKTGLLHPHSPRHLITKLASVTYDAEAAAPRWEQFMLEIMRDDVELVEFLQRAVGYSLTGDSHEQCLFFCYGKGANGKSTFLEILRHVFGDYAQQADFESFMVKHGGGPRNDIARMRGARLVTASEAPSLMEFDARMVQQLTGGDTIVARRLYEEHFEFKPHHKMFLAANHKPIVREQTEAFWRRMRLIPFTATFRGASRDSSLTAKLVKELPGILTWAVRGCALWRKDRLPIPAAVRTATNVYKDDNDTLGEFIEQQCTLDANIETVTHVLYRAYVNWWQEQNGPRSQPLTTRVFGRMLGERSDLTQFKTRAGRGWRGIALRMHGT